MDAHLCRDEAIKKCPTSQLHPEAKMSLNSKGATGVNGSTVVCNRSRHISRHSTRHSSRHSSKHNSRHGSRHNGIHSSRHRNVHSSRHTSKHNSRHNNTTAYMHIYWGVEIIHMGV